MVVRIAALAVSLLVLLAGAASGQDRAIEVYKAANRTAAELLPLAETAMAGQGTAAVDPGTNSIVVIGVPSAVEQTLSLLRSQDRARRTVVLHYRSKRLDQVAGERIRIDWSVGGGHLRVGNVIFPEGHTGVRLSAGALPSHGESDLAGTLRVLDGEVGQIGTGRSVPLHQRGVSTPSTAFVSAERGFTARPRILAQDRVQVEITSSDDTVGTRGLVELAGAATTVIVKPGETVALGGISHSSNERRAGSREISASERAEEELVLLLTIDVE